MVAGVSGHDFDAMAEALPHMTSSIVRANADALNQLREPFNFNEQYLVGWSKRFERPAAAFHTVDFRTYDVTRAMYVGDAEGIVLCGPWLPEMEFPSLADISTADGLLAIARRQEKVLSDWFGAKAAGGELIAIELFRDSMRSRFVGTIENPPQFEPTEIDLRESPLNRNLPPTIVPSDDAAWGANHFIAGLTALTSRSPNGLAEGFRAPFYTAGQRAETAREIADVRSEAAQERNTLTAQHNKDLMARQSG